MIIVTIDFDIIMAPVIGSYNDLVSDDYPVDEMIERFPYMRSALPDFYIYDYLTQYVTEVFHHIKDIDDVYFINSHEEVVPYVEGNDNILYNIDHHHDIGYNTKDLNLRIREADCSNWVKFLKEKQNIKEYKWIHDKYSEEVEDDKVNRFIDDNYELKNFNLLTLGKNTDKLIICYSTPWVPADYKGLYMAWMNTWSAFKDIRIDKNK